MLISMAYPLAHCSIWSQLTELQCYGLVTFQLIDVNTL